MMRRGAHRPLLLFAGMVALAGTAVAASRPGSLVPDEDQGYYIGAVLLPDGAALQRTDAVAASDR